MIDVETTLLKTINKAFNNLRYLGQTNPRLFRSILEVCIIQNLIEWSNGFSIVPTAIKEALRDRQDYILLHNCGFDITQLKDHVYVSANVPMPGNNDFWKLLSDSPTKVIELKDGTVSKTSQLSWKEDPNYSPVVVEYSTEGTTDAGPAQAVNEDGTKVFDDATATIHDKMNVYVNRTTGTIWYYDTDCTWHATGGNTEKTNEATIRSIIAQYKVKYSDEKDGYILTELSTDEEANNQIGVVSASDINDML